MCPCVYVRQGAGLVGASVASPCDPQIERSHMQSNWNIHRAGRRLRREASLHLPQRLCSSSSLPPSGATGQALRRALTCTHLLLSRLQSTLLLFHLNEKKPGQRLLEQRFQRRPSERARTPRGPHGGKCPRIQIESQTLYYLF